MNKLLMIGLLSCVLVFAVFTVVRQQMAVRRLSTQTTGQEEGVTGFTASRLAARVESGSPTLSQQTSAGGDVADAHSVEMSTAASAPGATTHESADAEGRRDGTTARTGATTETKRDVPGDAGQATATGWAGASSETAAAAGNTRSSAGSRRADASSEAREKSLEETTAQAAERSKTLLSQAQQHIRGGNYMEAEELLQQSVEHDLGNTRAWKQLAQLQRQMGLFDEEMDTYRQWMGINPADAEAYYMTAEAYARIGMDAEARQYLSVYEGMAGNSMGEYIRMSHLYRSMNDREDEGRILAQWMTTTPESTDARNAWADYQRRMGNYGEALAQYELMASVAPENPHPYRQMAEIYRRNGEYEQAQQYYETALAVRPGDIPTMNRLAAVRYTAGDLYGALNVYTEIIALEPGTRAAEQAERRASQIERQLEYQQ